MSELPTPDARWVRRLTLGLPVLVVVLVLVAANLLGGILTAKDLRADYEQLLASAPLAPPAAAAEEPVEEAADPAPAPPDDRPSIDVTLVLDEFSVIADVDEVPAWAEITFHVVNEGGIPHDAAVGDTGTAMLDHGEEDTFVHEAPGSGVIEVICTVAGHEAAGMVLELPIAGDETSPDTAGVSAVDAAPADHASPDNADAYDGDKPDLAFRDPYLPARPEGEVIEVTWTMTEEVMQVAEGVWQEVWTFDGQVPGPTLRARVGDTVRVTIENPAENQVAHSIDFHSSQTAWNRQMVDVAPGESLTYEFEATHAGVYMYHCGTAPALHHIGNGMYGAMVVEPAEGLDEVDHEVVFVQSEYYLGPQGQPGDFAKMNRGVADPDLVVFNGVADQYAAQPIEVGVEETIRAWVLNAGPSADSSFHVVGTIFDATVKEGVELRADNAGRWGSQAVDLAPAQGGYVEFTLAEDGLYPIVTHAFNHVGRGALGLFKAGDGGPDAAGGH